MSSKDRKNTSNLLYVNPYNLDGLQATMQAGWEEVARLAERLCEEQGTGRGAFGLEGLNDEASFDAKAKRGQANKAIVEMQLGEQLNFSSVADEFHTQLMRRVIATEIAHLSPDGKFRYSQIIEAITCRIGDAADALETVWGSELGLLQMLSEALASSSDGYEAVRRLAVSVDDKCLATFLKTNPPVPQEEQEVFRLLAWACQSERNRREAFWEIAVSVYLRPRVSQLRLIEWKLQQAELCQKLAKSVKDYRLQTKKAHSAEQRSRGIASLARELAVAKGSLPDRNECFLDTISLLAEFHAQLGRVDRSGSPRDYKLEPVLDEFQEKLNQIHSFNCLSDYELLVINEYLRYGRIQCARKETSRKQYEPISYCAVDVTELNYDPLKKLAFALLIIPAYELGKQFGLFRETRPLETTCRMAGCGRAFYTTRHDKFVCSPTCSAEWHNKYKKWLNDQELDLETDWDDAKVQERFLNRQDQRYHAEVEQRRRRASAS